MNLLLLVFLPGCVWKRGCVCRVFDAWGCGICPCSVGCRGLFQCSRDSLLGSFNCNGWTVLNWSKNGGPFSVSSFLLSANPKLFIYSIQQDSTFSLVYLGDVAIPSEYLKSIFLVSRRCWLGSTNHQPPKSVLACQNIINGLNTEEIGKAPGEGWSIEEMSSATDQNPGMCFP